MATPGPTPPRIFALHAHPDDLEFQCAGTLALLRRAGCQVTMATMTPGDCGSAEHDAEAIAAIRRGEARAAADLIGAEALCLEFRDLAIFNDDESRRRVVEALRRTRPDLVLTAPPVDYLCDHEMTSVLVRDACFCAPIPNYATRQWDPAPPTALRAGAASGAASPRRCRRRRLGAGSPPRTHRSRRPHGRATVAAQGGGRRARRRR